MQKLLVLCSPAIIALLSGCATDPRYANTQTQDATTIVASSDGQENAQSGAGMQVEIEKIDGAIAPEPPLYLAPGFHHLTLRLTDHLNNQAIVTTSIIVETNQAYRVEASREGRSFTIQVIDVASGETVCTESVTGRYVPALPGP
jgi:hypothetical protein